MPGRGALAFDGDGCWRICWFGADDAIGGYALPSTMIVPNCEITFCNSGT